VLFPTRDNSILDLILTDINEYDGSIEKLAPLSNSDHCAMLLKSVKAKSTRYTVTFKRVFTKHCKQNILAEISTLAWENVLSASNINEKVMILHNTINDIIEKQAPLQRQKSRENKPPWINRSILKVMRARDRAYSKGSKSFKFLKTLVRSMIKTSKRRFIDAQLNNQTNTRMWWRMLNVINSKKADAAKLSYKINEEWISHTTLCDRLNKYYKSVGGEQLQQQSHDTTSHQNNQLLELISIGEIKYLLSLTQVKALAHWISQHGYPNLGEKIFAYQCMI
jgi:hypothetical protein